MPIKLARKQLVARQLDLIWDNWRQLINLRFLDGTVVEVTEDIPSGSGNLITCYHGLGRIPQGFVPLQQHGVQLRWSRDETATEIVFDTEGSSVVTDRKFRALVY